MQNNMKTIIVTFFLFFVLGSVFVNAQAINLLEEYENFKRQTQYEYKNYRDKVNIEYANFIRKTWEEYSAFAPIPKPKEDNPIPPRPYEMPFEDNHISFVPDNIPIIPLSPQPKPIEPIQENTLPIDNRVKFIFYGLNEYVRVPTFANIKFNAHDINNIADAWNTLCDDAIDNTIYDALELRDKYNLSDWAYLQLLETIANKYCDDKNGATLLMAFLYCQSGYQMRLAVDNSRLYMLFSSQHQIFDKGYFVVDGITFYPYGEPEDSIKICAASFEGEKPLSLFIVSEQNFGTSLSNIRTIQSKRYADLRTNSQVPIELIDFFSSYPTSVIDDNIMTRSAMYANTPLAKMTKEILYPVLKMSIEGCTNLEATNKLLNWVQTGFEYEYDDKVWEHDRAFFAEETLYYSFADCEDRSILFSRLVRDLLGLDVALIYYPGHLATAVKFDTEVQGDAMLINGDRYVVCDPTYIGAPVGAQMPELEYDKAEAIVLKR